MHDVSLLAERITVCDVLGQIENNIISPPNMMFGVAQIAYKSFIVYYGK